MAEEFEETLAWLGERTEAMGITRLANITGLDVIGIPVFAAVRPTSRSLSVAQGKGRTVCHAKVSALMEAAEGFHAERIEQPLVLASQAELGLSSSIAEISQFPSAEGFRPEAAKQIFWIRGWDLVSETQLWVPYDLVSTAYTVEMMDNYSGLYATTAGLAAGTTIARAIDHGLREVIERDATLLYLLSSESSRNRRRIRIDTISDSDIVELLHKFRSNGVFVALWDITSDIGIPAFFCVIADESQQCSEHNFFAGGAGCDLDKNRALVAALTEAAQSRLTTISGAREDLVRSRYSSEVNSIFGAEYAILRSSEGALAYDDIDSEANLSLSERLEVIAKRLSYRGLDQIIVVNLTKSEIRIPVVKVIVPGMEVALDVAGSMPGSSMSRRLTAK